MPILLKSDLVTLSANTEQEATSLLNSGKAKFYADLKQGRVKGRNVYQGMQVSLKIEENRFSFCQVKYGQSSDDVLK